MIQTFKSFAQWAAMWSGEGDGRAASLLPNDNRLAVQYREGLVTRLPTRADILPSAGNELVN